MLDAPSSSCKDSCLKKLLLPPQMFLTYISLKFCWFFCFTVKSRFFFHRHFVFEISFIPRTSDLSIKVNSTWSLTASTLLNRLVLLSVCFIYPMSGRYSTNWDWKGWPGLEIQTYYGCLWFWLAFAEWVSPKKFDSAVLTFLE